MRIELLNGSYLTFDGGDIIGAGAGAAGAGAGAAGAVADMTCSNCFF